jgi:poly(3-hydroxybutyrate) depolymerase
VRLSGERTSRTAQAGVLVLLSTLTVALRCVLSDAASATATIDGASQAVCTPSPCLAADKPISFELEGVENGDGTTSTREYGVERPRHLTASPTNRAPAVLVFYQGGNCGLKPSGRFASLAPRERFVVVYMEVPCGRGDNNWDKRNVDPQTSTAVNDEPYVSAVVEAITQCPGSEAAIDQCVDPQRIYAAGASSGGNMVADVMCDVENSPRFRGYLIDSSSLQLFGGAPSCPSANRGYFAMLALSNYGIDGGLYYDEAANPHLDVPAFADWAAARLGCTGRRVDDAVGYPIASTLRYSYAAPCAYATAGSQAVVALGVQDGGHTWTCQDSDAQAQPLECTNMPVPPGLTAGGLPDTNGLFVEREFWDFVAKGASYEAASPLRETSPPLVSLAAPADGSSVSGTISVDAHATDDGPLAAVRLELDGRELGTATASGAPGEYSFAWDTTEDANETHLLRVLATDEAGNLATAYVRVTVANAATGGEGPPGEVPPGGGAGQGALLTDEVGAALTGAGRGAADAPSFVALGDGYSSGEGNAHYLPGTDTARNRCHRSTVSYPYIASTRLSAGPSGLAFRACDGARIADLYREDRNSSEPAQLAAIGGATRLVTVSAGQADALLPAVLRNCMSKPAGCRRRWRRRTAKALDTTSRRLARLYEAIAAKAPHARVLVVGYPRPFAGARAGCGGAGGQRRLSHGAAEWVDSYVRDLDEAMGRAADRAHVTYLGASYGAFAGHELCTRRPAFNAQLDPNGRGQALLAGLVEKGARGA